MKKILIFGESVIDKYKNFELVGGAPLHIALILKKKKINSTFVSSIGNDKDGLKIKKILTKFNVSKKFVKVNHKLKTGVSIIKQKNNRNYFKIDKKSAWDSITNVPTIIPHLFYTGSIVARSPENIKSLKKILNKEIKYIFFDLNLRYPFINTKFIKYMIEKKVTHLKMTENEYNYVKKIYNNNLSLIDIFSINKKLKYIVITKGNKGSNLYLRNNIEIKYNSNKKSRVVNTVGAGDVFCAHLIKGLINEESLTDSFNDSVEYSKNSVTNYKCY